MPRSLRISLIALRLASSVSTASSRKDVAVGIERLSFMARARDPAAPRSGFASPSITAGAATPLPSAESTSDLVILPPAPLPFTPDRSTPLAWAARRATGVARAPSPSSEAGGASSVTPSAGAEGAAAAPSPEGASPFVISARGLPTSTVSSGPTRILVIVPEAGAGTSASTLSVDTSTTVSPSAIWSPSETCHSSTVPSVTDSPISGMTTSRPPPSSSLPAETEASSVVAIPSVSEGVSAPAPLDSAVASSSAGSPPDTSRVAPSAGPALPRPRAGRRSHRSRPSARRPRSRRRPGP